MPSHFKRSMLLHSVVVVALFLFLAVISGSSAVVDETCSAEDGSCQAATNCKDEHASCKYWAILGECNSNAGYMHVTCPKSCDTCIDEERRQAVDMGVGQILEDFSVYQQVRAQDTAKVIESAREYMKQTKVSKALKELCRNDHEFCAIWAVTGECETNPTYMKKQCSPVCQTCEYLSVENRCPIDPEAPNAWGPGDLDKMFTKLTTEPYLSKYDVEILSSPKTTGGGPWVITMENVVSELEAERLIELGAVEGYKRSADIGKLRADGTHESKVNAGRTSTNAWCQNECYEDEVVQRVIHRISNVTDIPEPNSESLQLLRYEPEQFYQLHHDYVDHHIKRQQGVRILTVYLYLNDVEAGGGTNFNKLDITVMPKRGRALLWPSVKNDKPDKKDGRTMHQALPVEAGIKYGANAWFHMRDFKAPNDNGCQ